MRPSRLALTVLALAALAPRPAHATFHLMQIEQVIGGVNGNTSIQAIQLRMRASGQNFVTSARLIAHDASDATQVLIIAFPSNVTNAALGARVLVATSGFAAATTPNLAPDFIMTHPIPASFLAAGSLTYEDNFGDVYWRLSWGGANYTGPEDGLITNDADGNFGPPMNVPLPSTSTSSALFQFGATALSTNNLNDYVITPGAATFTNNAGASGSINALVGVDAPSALGDPLLGAPVPNPVANSVAYTVTLPRESRVGVRLVDLGGRVVRTLVDGSLAAGEHRFEWNAPGRGGAAIPNGVYFLEMTGAGPTQVRKLVLMR